VTAVVVAVPCRALGNGRSPSVKCRRPFGSRTVGPGSSAIAVGDSGGGHYRLAGNGSGAAWHPLLVLHAPLDPVVSVREASRVFIATRRPTSFIALDGVDHVVADSNEANHVAGLVDAWVQRGSQLPLDWSRPPRPRGAC